MCICDVNHAWIIAQIHADSCNACRIMDRDRGCDIISRIQGDIAYGYNVSCMCYRYHNHKQDRNLDIAMRNIAHLFYIYIQCML